jgi:hypothetical protein
LLNQHEIDAAGRITHALKGVPWRMLQWDEEAEEIAPRKPRRKAKDTQS